MVKARFEWIELFVIALGFFITFGIASSPTPTEPNFVPNAVTGLTTIAGVLTAFIGFWLIYAYSHVNDEASKKWLSKRIKVVVLVIGFSLLFIVGSFTDLVYGRLESAYKTALFGTAMLMLVLNEIMFIFAFREEFLK